MKKGLNKSATFPCSGKVQLSPIDGSQGILTTSLHDRSCLESVNPVYARSTSLPATLKLVSAMKGGREQQGLPLKMKPNVKWDPDVYDPRATSMSHAVKSHQQRPRAKKKDHHKHKDKPSKWGGAAEKKQHPKRTSAGNITDPQNLRLQAPGDRLLLDGSSRSGVEVLDCAVSGQESKCGGQAFSWDRLGNCIFRLLRPPDWDLFLMSMHLITTTAVVVDK